MVPSSEPLATNDPFDNKVNVKITWFALKIYKIIIYLGKKSQSRLMKLSKNLDLPEFIGKS